MVKHEGQELNRLIISGECQEEGSDYKCLCNEGYRFSGITCTDINECEEEAPCGNGQCHNTIGSHTYAIFTTYFIPSCSYIIHRPRFKCEFFA